MRVRGSGQVSQLQAASRRSAQERAVRPLLSGKRQAVSVTAMTSTHRTSSMYIQHRHRARDAVCFCALLEETTIAHLQNIRVAFIRLYTLYRPMLVGAARLLGAPRAQLLSLTFAFRETRLLRKQDIPFHFIIDRPIDSFSPSLFLMGSICVSVVQREEIMHIGGGIERSGDFLQDAQGHQSSNTSSANLSGDFYCIRVLTF